MKKIATTIIVAILLVGFINCSSTTYNKITKIEKDTYALEVSEFKWFWLYFPIILPLTEKKYLALCKAEANGNLVCNQGEGARLGFGAVK
jgi:heme/copper-type cytochrome/quinol oxidase subunit 2